MENYGNLKDRKTLEEYNLEEVIRQGKCMEKNDGFNINRVEDDGLVDSILEPQSRVSPLMRSVEIGVFSLGFVGCAFGAYIGYDVAASEGYGLLGTIGIATFGSFLIGIPLAFVTLPTGAAVGAVTHGIVRGAQAIKNVFSNEDKEINYGCECPTSI